MKRLSKNKIVLILCGIWLLSVIFLKIRNPVTEIEDKELLGGVGVGLVNCGKDNYMYSLADNVYFFIEDKNITSDVFKGKASTIGQTREERATKLPKEYFLGHAKIIMMDEFVARKSIRPTIDILFKNQIVNDAAYLLVSKGSSDEYLKHKIKGVGSSSEYIEGIIKQMENFNFFKEEFKLRNIYLILDSEGRNIVLPYIQLDEKGFKVNGVVVFNKDKEVSVLNIHETRSLNLLRNNSGKGIITIQKNHKDYINYYAKSKKKVNCIKENGKYKFIIEIDLTGDIMSNTLYKDVEKKKDVIKNFQNDIEEKVGVMCNEFIQTMKSNLKVDCLELGRIAAAKYGRGTGVDWNEIICNSNIEVKVKATVDRVGRGQY